MMVYGFGSRYLLPGTEGLQGKRGWPRATNRPGATMNSATLTPMAHCYSCAPYHWPTFARQQPCKIATK